MAEDDNVISIYADDDVPDDVFVEDPGPVIDAEIEGPPSRLHGKREFAPPRDVKATVPSIDEWMDFTSRVCLKLFTEFYISMAFRGVDENALSDREIERIQLSKDERDRIARPFAELAHKSKITRKHGRKIIAFADSGESLVLMSIWLARVNRISSKYKPKHAKPDRNDNNDVSSRSAEANGSRYGEYPYAVYSPGTG